MPNLKIVKKPKLIKSSEVLEIEEIEKHGKFKARPFKKKMFEESTVVSSDRCVQEPTRFEAFSFCKNERNSCPPTMPNVVV